jgi:hypothetical protein
MPTSSGAMFVFRGVQNRSFVRRGQGLASRRPGITNALHALHFEPPQYLTIVSIPFARNSSATCALHSCNEPNGVSGPLIESKTPYPTVFALILTYRIGENVERNISADRIELKRNSRR